MYEEEGRVHTQYDRPALLHAHMLRNTALHNTVHHLKPIDLNELLYEQQAN